MEVREFFKKAVTVMNDVEKLKALDNGLCLLSADSGYLHIEGLKAVLDELGGEIIRVIPPKDEKDYFYVTAVINGISVLELFRELPTWAKVGVYERL